jgi:hypothetical protein
MKKIFLSILLFVATLPLFAQLNVQLHYDFADALYGKELSNRPHWTATIENFKADKWGSTYFFVDLDFGGNTMKSAYAEISREFKLGTSPFAAHVEYNGGLSGGGSYNDAYLAGAAWNWANQDFSKTFSFQVLYKYLARQVVGSKHSWQLTTVWGIHFAKGLCTFSGYADVWHDNSVKGNLVLSSEPQFWFNLNALESVPDDFLLSLGTEVELTKSLVWPTDGLNDRFYAIPTLAAKWTF